jgi:hypothetical protein
MYIYNISPWLDFIIEKICDLCEVPVDNEENLKDLKMKIERD